MTAPQAASLILAACLVAIALTHSPGFFLQLLHAGAAILFGACLAFRLAAIAGRRPVERIDRPAAANEPLPVYSILVALHHETTVVPRLVAALSRLDWPTSRLEIKLICEADDVDTIGAVERAIAGRPHFDIVLVPPCEPRTKPKALNYALPLVSGEFVVLYDAEDEPDPGQLREAYRAFRSGPGDLACLQAPLVIRNGDRNWLTGLFALEYALLFRRFLPWLAAHGLPLPLGGTSNHFVRARLIAVGGWDSHNVTEDADLGLRLARKGHSVGTITRPTFEDAPERLGVWTRQRTRWMKGWFQTYFLHMRNPRRLHAELGLKGAACFHLLFLGMLTPALAHPVFLAIAGLLVFRLLCGAMTIEACGPLLALDLFNAAGGYTMFVLLSVSALDRQERRSLPWFYVFLPLYWVLIAAATLRAIAQLFVTPHKWEKTPHGLESRMDAGDQRYRVEPNFDGLTAEIRRARCQLQRGAESQDRRPVGGDQ
nr:glycosyltransferase family 2 protein [Aurantimonas sp. VKM B-3413]